MEEYEGEARACCHPSLTEINNAFFTIMLFETIEEDIECNHFILELCIIYVISPFTLYTAGIHGEEGG
jgi:hypothetical protein